MRNVGAVDWSESSASRIDHLQIDHDMSRWSSFSPAVVVERLVQDLPYRVDPTKETRAASDHADMAATRQHELDHTSRDQGSNVPERAESSC